MSKFLNETGLSHFWEKVKTYLIDNFISLDGGTMNESAEIDIPGVDGSITIIDCGGMLSRTKDNKAVYVTGKNIRTLENDVETLRITPEDGITIKDKDNSTLAANIQSDGIHINGEFKTVGMGIEEGGIVASENDTGKVSTLSSDGLSIGTSNGTSRPTTTIDPNGTISTGYIVNNNKREETTIQGSSLKVKSVSTTDAQSYVQTTLAPGSVNSPKFVKQGGTASQVLMADGSIKTIGAKSGIATLDANGRIPLSQLGNLDTTLFQVVDALPTSGIVKNRIYLVKSTSTSTQNIYAEYIYTGDVSATYDASKWEKLGEYKSDVDLSSYSKKSETVRAVGVDDVQNTGAQIALKVTSASGTSSHEFIPSATTSKAGVMAASDKKALDTLTARYPLGISSFSASPNLVEVGVAADVTFSWDFTNTDFHPITSQSIVVDGAAAATVAVGTKSYKKTGLAGATTASNKSASITINGSLKKSVNITYHYPSYIGLVADGTTITEAVVKGLTKSIEWGKSKTKALNQSNQKIVYAYPASYGDLTSIKDGNGFQGFAGYAKQTLTVGGQSYNVYVQKLPATANSTYTFA